MTHYQIILHYNDFPKGQKIIATYKSKKIAYLRMRDEAYNEALKRKLSNVIEGLDCFYHADKILIRIAEIEI